MEQRAARFLIPALILVFPQVMAQLSNIRCRNGLKEGKSMYCSSCGVAVAQGLSYCNYCGATLNGVKGDQVIKSSEIKPESLVAAMGAVFVLGLVAIPMLIGMMKSVLNLYVWQFLA